MNIKTLTPWISCGLFIQLAAILLMAVAPPARAADSEFSKATIDIGIVAKDSDRTARFLTNVIGFKEVKGFEVNGDLGKKLGLIDGHATQARVFV